MQQSKHTIHGSIVATVGPASDDSELLEQLFTNGLNVVRINLSHGTTADAQQRFDRIRSLDDSIPILLDLSGPKIRIGNMKESIILNEGDLFTLTQDKIVGSAEQVQLAYKELYELVKSGDHFFLNDGLIKVEVVEVESTDIHTKVLTGGPLSSRKGVNTPGIPITMYAPTEKDQKDIEASIGWEPDFYGVSFVRRPEDLKKVRDTILTSTSKVPDLISKIEHQDALDQFTPILKASDGIMVARGDLGVEIAPSEVPLEQKKMIRKANFAGVPVIVATQMLESMVVASRPTRAEVSDVANAILDGADAVMLSAETATGKHPLAAIQVMRNIWLSVQHATHKRSFEVFQKGPDTPTADAVARAAVQFAETIDAAAIIANTLTGRTTKAVAKYRPEQNVLGITTEQLTYRQMQLQYGIIPYLSPRVYNNTDAMIYNSVLTAEKMGIVTPQDDVIIIAGSLLGLPYRTNLIQHYTVKDILAAEAAKVKFAQTYEIK